MDSVFQSVILGFVQGASEFLPVSSSGHLILVPRLLGWPDPGLTFDVALHFGTLLALIACFWRDWMAIVRSAFLPTTDSLQPATYNRRPTTLYPKNLLFLLVLATVPGVLAGFFLEDLAATVFRSPLIIAANLFFWGLVLFLVDRSAHRQRNIGDIGWKDAIITGIAQALAIVPGTSRSGITITAGLARGLDRVSAARFSFLLAMPVIFGASVLKFGDFVTRLDGIMLAGVAASAISGFMAIRFLLKMVEKTDYRWFFWYRTLVAAGIVVLFIGNLIS